MELQELKNKILDLEKKYSEKSTQVLEYYDELIATFYEYADLNNNTDYEFETVFNDVVSGEDCMGLVMSARQGELYYWKEDNGETIVDKIDYKYLANLSKQALKCYEKEKNKDYDIC